MRRSVVVPALLATLVSAASARADGGPSPGVANGGTGVPGERGVRYVALAGARETIVAVVDSATGSVENWRSLTVPCVAIADSPVLRLRVADAQPVGHGWQQTKVRWVI